MKIAVIGAGLAGLTAASDLSAAGHDVVVFEKSRGSGGRTATRRGPDGMRFDHGAPILEDGTEPLSGVIGVVPHALQLPDGSRASTVVGVDSNNGPAKCLAETLDVRAGIRVSAIVPDQTGWTLVGDDTSSLGAAQAVIVTAPAPQAAELLEPVSPPLAGRAARVRFTPCWSVMAAWSEPLHLPFTAARDVSGLAWAIAEAPKPGRADGERWVLQATGSWSQRHLEDDAEAVGAALLGRFASLAERELPEPAHLAIHRWRYSRPATPLAERFLQDGSLFIAGDWCGGDTAGAAIRSGRAVASAIAG